MKKYLFTSVISIILSIVIIVHLYKTKDIEWVDNIVELSAEVLGLKPEMVVEKVERGMREMDLADDIVMATLPTDETVKLDSPSYQSVVDSTLNQHPIIAKKTQTIIPEVTLMRESENVEKKDSVVVAIKVEQVKQKKLLFNGAIDEQNDVPSTTHESKFVYFKAEVNTRQRFYHDQEIAFRTSEPVAVGDMLIPDKYVFYARANVFNGRVFFMVTSINNYSVNAQNYYEQLPGIPISASLRFGEDYFLSDGFPVVFGIQL